MKNIRNLKKRIKAFIMALAVLFSTLLPDYIGINRYLMFESYAEYEPGKDTGLTFHLTMLPNNGKQKKLPAWSGLYNTNMMRKEYFMDGTGEYTEFANKYVWCVANHTVHAPAGTHALIDNVYSYENLPEKQGGGGSIDKFNFTMAILALYYFAKPTNLTDPYADTADYLIAKCIIAPAFETGELKNEWEFDQMRILNVLYGYYAEEFNPDTTGSTLIRDQLMKPGYKGPYGMDVDYAMYKVWEVWSAAHALCEMDWSKGVGYAKAVTEPAQGSDGKYHVYAEFNADALNGKYYEDLKCKTAYGDWTYEGYSGGKMDFSSPTGTVPEEGIADMYYEPDSAFDNIFTNFDEGQLIRFRFNGGYQHMLASKLTGNFSVRIGGTTATPAPHGGEGGEVERFKHEETWNATYNVELYKMDAETGKGLSGSMFDILESFDDSQLTSTSLDLDSPGTYTPDGSLIEGTEWGTDDIPSNWDGDLGYTPNEADLYNWANDDGTQFEKWSGTDDPCTRDNDITNNEGHLMQNNGMDEAGNTVAHTDVKTYTYTKGYCGGHPAPEIEYAELTGDPKQDPAIIAANQELHNEAWKTWAKGVEDCQKLAAEGGFFHAINAGEAKAAMEADRDQFYEDFISLTYDYSAVETKQRDGYVLHGGHTDDVPIETVTVTSSESKGGGSLMMMAPPKMMKSAKASKAKAEEDTAFLFGSSLSIETASPEEHASLLGSGEKEEDTEEKPEAVNTGAENAPAAADVEITPAAEAEPAAAEEVLPAEAVEEAAEIVEAVPEETVPEDAVPEEPVAKVSFLDRLLGVFDSYAEEPEEPASFLYEEDLASPSTVKKTGADIPSETGLTGFFKTAAKKAKKLMKGLLGGSGGGSRSSASFSPSEVSPHSQGDSTIVDHTFIVYDHRVEGEIHINKRDFDLSDSDKTAFDDYARVNGDGTLEGAVYGLFAKTDLRHPDSDGDTLTADDTGILFHADELVSVATTDRDGNATFSVITVAPGQTWDYALGDMKSTGLFSGATNMYVADGSAETKRGTEKYSGVHGPISHTETTSDANVYKKHSSNVSSSGYPIQDNQTLNGSCWIGRPLVLGEYYVKELTRSEGYELSVYGASHTGYSNRTAFAAGGGSLVEGTASVVEGSWNVNEGYTGNVVEVKAGSIGDAGFDVYVNNVPASLVTDLTPTVKSYYMKKETGTATVMVDDYANLPVDATPGAFVLIGGNKVEATVGESKTLPNGETVTVAATTSPGDAIETYQPNNMFSKTVPGAIIEFAYATDEDFISNANASLIDAGYKAATTASPYLFLPKTGTRLDWCKEINDTLKDMLWCNAFSVESVTAAGIKLRYDYIQPSPLCTVVCDEQHSRVLVAEPLTIGTTLSHVWVPYEMSEWITYSYKTGTFVEKMSAKHKVPASDSVPEDFDLSTHSYVTEPAKTYWVYAAGEKLRDANGDIVMQMVKTGSHPETQPITKPIKHYDSTPKYESITYDAANSRFVIHVTKAQSAYTLPSDYDRIGYEFVWASATAGGISSCYYGLNNLKVTASPSPKTAGMYIKYVTLSYSAGDVSTDGGTKASPVAVTERPIRQRVSVKKDIVLNADMDKDGKPDAYRDNTYGVALNTAVADFKFKAYLKSNLERLYRDEDGTVQWIDENGNTMTPVLSDVDGDGENDTLVWKYDSAFGKKTVDWPEIDAMKGTGADSLNVEPIYTAVPHETASLTVGRIANNVFQKYQDPNTESAELAMLSPFTMELRAAGGKAVKTNASLYSYKGTNTNVSGSPAIQEDQNPEYTRILEMSDVKMEDGSSMKTVRNYDYDKFFDAISVANGDKWDNGKPTYTSWRPIGNKANRSAFAIDNAKRSDRVRQFAINWYLSDEVAKLVSKVPASLAGGKYTEDEAKRELAANNYSEAVYDEALNNAIKKAENYLKPFFKYDLDTIYALKWDSDAAGGTDADLTTLSANRANTKADGNDEFVNTSAYLPYGVYVVVEQQPGYDGTDSSTIEYLNKHYDKDRPKEVLVPSLYDGAVNDTADNLAAAYSYKAADTMAEMSKSSKFLIRFGEEWENDADDARRWVIRAHSYYGNFEVYPYGLDVDKLSGTIASRKYTGFTITQDTFEPLKDYYDTNHRGEEGAGAIGTERGGNDGCQWKIYDLNTAYQPTANNSAYDTGKHILNDYFYASVSEDAGLAKNVLFHDPSKVTPDNRSGMTFKDVASMTGILTAYEGKYAQMLVPWSVTDAADYNTYKTADFEGFADVNAADTFYTAKLRIEKLDAETHENILHDDAVFAIYKAQRDTATGDVKFYDVDTDITGSKEFVTAYCDAKTVMPVDPSDPSGIYQGTVKKGTPICAEADLVILGDWYGNQTSEFKAFSTAQDIPAKTESGNVSTDPATYMTQNVGYIETPQPLGAGVYVLVEKKAPSGYVRTAPVAVEIYSDKVTYYKEGKKDERILAAIYDEPSTNDLTANANKPEDSVNVAQIYVEDDPIKLTVEKVKESSSSSADTTADKTVTYRYSGRITGTTTDFTGREDVVLAFNSAGKYQGYAWKKGTLEYLASLKEKYDADGDPLTKVEIVYNGSVFAGYGFVTVPLLTADDDNKYAANALLTLYDAIQIRRNETYPFGDPSWGDLAFHGLKVKRDPSTNRVTRIYVEKGYAGVKTDFREELGTDGTPKTVDYQTGYDKTGKPVYTTGNVWNAVTVERGDTDILYYDLSGIELTFTRDLGNGDTLYGYDKNRKLVDVQRLVNDEFGYDETDTDISIYAYKGQQAVFELTGGDLTLAKFNEAEKCLDVDAGTIVYHLDADGNRDALVDPHTGMAFVVEKCDDGHGGTYEKYLVWPVETYKDAYGYVIARDKITTSRVATIGENVDADKDALTAIPRAADPNGDAVAGTAATYKHDETGSVTGSYESLGTGESHQQTTDRTTKYNHKNLNGQTLVTDNNGIVSKKYSPVYDRNGNILYYQRSNDTYDKGSNLFDRDEDFVRYDPSDGLWEYSDNAYRQNTKAELFDTDGKTEDPITKKLYHRYGEGYVLQNTWVSSDETPNDPFRTLQTDGQADILKRVPEGTYIMEELTAPEGYAKAFPAGITVKETVDAQAVKMVDHTLKVEVAKIDGQQKFKVDVFDMDKGGIKTGTAREGAAIYSYGLVPGAKLVLYKADRVSTTDYARYPKGYYLVKAEATPFKYKTSNWKASTPTSDILECVWVTTTDEPIYLEGLPEGDYLLYEEETPEGFVTADPVEIEVRSDLAVQEILVNDDHNKVEIEKFYIDSHTSAKKALSGAKFELHKAKLDGGGNVEYDADGNPKYEAAVLTAWETTDDKVWPGFAEKFRDAYRTNGTATVTISWTDGHGVTHTATKTACEQLDQTLAGGVPTAYPTNALMTFKDELGRVIRVKVYEQKMASGTVDYTMDFAFDVRKDPLLGAFAVSYTTAAGVRRFDYIPTGKYVAVETAAPTGYVTALPKLIAVSETTDIQRCSVENREAQIVISKVLEGHTKETVGATLTLYRAEAGALVKDAAHLIETWQSGTDGTYTEEDLFRGRILSGYSVGDLRPHSINKLPAGTYYLVEEKAPGYYCCIEPLKTEYTDLSTIKFVRAVDEAVDGRLVIEKKDESGNPLPGATFLLQRYEKDEYLTPVWENTYVMASGTLTVSDLPVGEVQADGSVIPYRYRVSEILPPAGYQIDNKSYVFSFKPDNLGASYASGEAATFTVTVTDRKTSFKLSKKLLTSLGTDDSDDAFVDGAKLEVYDLIGTDLNGAPIYDPSAPLRTYTLSKSTHEYDLTGLTAGKTYVVAETLLPDGLDLMEPHMFAISADGRKIEALGSKMNSLAFNSIKPEDYRPGTENVDTDSIMSVKMSGRYAVSVNYEVTDAAGTVIETFPGGYDHEIRLDSGYTEGGSYTVTEKVTYSDGSTEVTDAFSELFRFDDTGKFTFHTRTADKVNLALRYEDGDLIDELDVTAADFEKLIVNPVSLENPLFTMTQTGKDAGDPIERSYAIENTLTIINPSHRASDAVVKVKHGPGISVISAGAGVVSGDTITFTVTDVPAYGTKTFKYFTKATGNEARADITLQIAGRTIVSERVVPCVLPNSLTVSYDVEGSGRKAFADEAAEVKIRLYNNADGKELAGTYNYGGSYTGTMRSGDSFTLKANEYIQIDTGIYHDVAYMVTRFADGRPFTEKGMTGNFTNVLGAAAVISQTFQDTSERTIFAKGGTYDLYETTQMSDGEKQLTNRMRFTLGDKASVEKIGLFDGKTRIYVEKKTPEGTALSDCVLEIYDATDALIDSWTTDGTKHTLNGILISGQQYRLHEKTSKVGYTISDDIIFTANTADDIDRIVMVDKPTWVEISKKAITGTDELSGCTLEVRDAATNALIESWVSTDAVHTIKAVLEAGKTYKLIETHPKDGYAFAEDITFTVSLDGSIDRVEMLDKPTDVMIHKTDITGTEELPGCTLMIKDSHGTVIETWVSEAAPHEIKAKLIADETYTLVEVKPADGYYWADDIAFTVSHDGTIDVVTMKDEKTKLTVSKTDMAGSAEIPGCKLEIRDAETGVVVDSWTSGTAPHVIEGLLIADHKYVLVETRPADGYAYADAIEFTMSRDGKVADAVTMKDDTTKVEISKVDIADSAELPGAKLQLKDKDGHIIDEWISGTTSHYLEAVLIAGETYTLTEIAAPDGYAYAEDVSFTVSIDGRIDKVIMKDAKTSVEIEKTKGATDALLPGAKIQILLASDKSLVYEFVTTEAVHEIKGLLIAGEKYIMHEVQAPAGYMVAEDVEFTVPTEAKDLTVRMADAAIYIPGPTPVAKKIAIRKVDPEGNALSGAKFKVLRENGTEKAVSVGLDGATFSFEVGTSENVLILEEEAPEGYQKSESAYEVHVDAEGKATIVSGDGLLSQYVPGSLVLTMTNKPLIRKKGRVVPSYDDNTDGKGRIRITYLLHARSAAKDTGDNSAPVAAAIVFAVSAILLGVLLLGGKKRKEEEER